MSFFTRFREGKMSLHRIEAFSDGVFAIIVTLLVLEIKVPVLHNHHSATELFHSLVELSPKIISWLISFIIICKFWINHHYLFELAKSADYAMLWINCLFLLLVSFIPFPTGLMGEYLQNWLAVAIFGLTITANAIVLIILYVHVAKNLSNKKEMIPDVIHKSLMGLTLYILGILASYYNVYISLFLYSLNPLFFSVPICPRHEKEKEYDD